MPCTRIDRQVYRCSRYFLCKVYRRRSLCLALYFRTIVVVDTIAVVSACKEIHQGRKCREATCLRVLLVSPIDTKVFVFAISGQIFFASYGIVIMDIDVTRKRISLAIRTLGMQCPRAFCINIARKSEVDVIVYGKVISAIFQEKTCLHLVAVRRHQYPRCIFRCERKKAKRNSQRQRQVFDYHISRTGSNVSAGFDSSLGYM